MKNYKLSSDGSSRVVSEHQISRSEIKRERGRGRESVCVRERARAIERERARARERAAPES
jgi:hypothetical protein